MWLSPPRGSREDAFTARGDGRAKPERDVWARAVLTGDALKRIALLLLLSQAACVTQRVPPPRAPDPSMPDVGVLPDGGGGMARVVIATDVPSRVERVTHHLARLDQQTAPLSVIGGAGLLCEETPCAVTLPYGDYELVFTGKKDHERGSTTTLVVRRPTVILNHTLGREHTPAGQGLAWLLATTGAVFLGVALGIAADQSALRATGSTAPGLALGGVGLMSLGGIVSLASPSTKQEGASTQWTPPGPTAGAAVRVQF